MNSIRHNAATDFFSFVSVTEGVASASLGPITGWVNGPLAVTELLNLYELYKEECPQYLDGHSSFVLYDADRNVVVAARDFFGAYPLYYATVGTGFLFSFSVKAIVQSTLFVPKINSLAVSEYLSWESINKPVSNQTFYQDLYSVLPGHKWVNNGGNVTNTPFARLDPGKQAGRMDDEYIRVFKDLFVQAIRRNIESHPTVASHLSGGLDSSSVSSVAQSVVHLPVHSFYIDTGTLAAQEETYVETLLNKWQQKGYPFTHHTVHPAINPYQTVVQTTAQLGQPSQLLVPVSTFLPIIEQAQQAGCSILLSGHGGDQVVGYGFEYLDELFRAGAWKTLKTALDQFADKRLLKSLTVKRSFRNTDDKRKAYAFSFFVKQLKRSRRLTQWVTALWVLFTQFGCRPRTVLTYMKVRKKQGNKRTVPELTNWIRADWSALTPSLPTREIDSLQLVTGPLSTHQQEQLDFLFSSLGIHYNEEIAQLHQVYGLETAHPFLDKNLLELTLNTPSRLRYGFGLGRHVLRQALTDYLPETIANRVDKGEFSDYTQEAFSALHSEFTRQTDNNHPVWSIVNKATFDEAVGIIFDEQYTIHQKNPYRLIASRVIYLAIWLDYVSSISSISA